MLLYLENNETWHWIYALGAVCSSHWAWVYEVDAFMLTEFEFVGMSWYEDLCSHFSCSVEKSLFISPRNNLMSMNHPDLETTNFDHIFFWQLFNGFIFKVSFYDMTISREGLNPVMNFPASHIASTENSVDFIWSNHFFVLRWHLGSPVRNMEVP